MMNNNEKIKLLKKYGFCVRYPQGRTPGIYVTVCPGCGEKIRSDEDLTNIGLAVTKRGTANFWHLRCQGKAWNNKIRWTNDKLA